MASTATPELKTYNGQCHSDCRGITFTVKMHDLYDPENKVTLCNCTLCDAHGLLNTYAKFGDIELTGEAKNKEWFRTYACPMGGERNRGKKKTMAFCGRCGVPVFFMADSPGDEALTEGVGVNLRAIEGVDMDKCAYWHYDGRKLPVYKE